MSYEQDQKTGRVPYEDYLLLFGLYDTYYITCNERYSIDSLHYKANFALRGYTLAKKIIGVQPMQGPIGQIHTLRTRYKAGKSAGS